MSAISLKINRATKTLRELTYDKMRQAIFAAHFKPGDRLVERTLCEELGVSRTVVREVLRQLEAEGLVETIPHQGPIVARLDGDKAQQIYEVRGLLEAMAVRACAQAVSPQAIDELEATSRQMEAAFSKNDADEVLRATTRYYEIIFKSGNKLFAWDVVQSLNARINQLRAMTIASPNRNRTSMLEMRRITAAIKQGDAEAAEAASWDHVNTAARIAKDLLADA